ncbi:MAG: deoxyribose-phosphate aldolase [Oscillospiraceae bacterium]|nr:deoxyribose-phosphate aldolase [Oscillospiraceae bacterium]
MSITAHALARMMDATLTTTTAGVKETEELIAFAKETHVYSLITNRWFIPMVVEGLRGTDTLPGAGCSAVNGSDLTEVKAFAARRAVELGAMECDMVMNIPLFKSGLYHEAVRDIRAVKDAIGEIPLKCIIEVGVLSDEEIFKATELVIEGGADFVKTATGKLPDPTTVHQVEVMARANRGRIAMKAAGGIRTLETVQQMIDLGVTRFGVGSGSAAKLLAAARG